MFVLRLLFPFLVRGHFPQHLYKHICLVQPRQPIRTYAKYSLTLCLQNPNQMSSPNYCYETLTNESSFRLFRFAQPQPDSPPGDQIQIHLFEADFENAPQFEAISYAWGQDGAKSTIWCNDRVLFVTPNVEAILQMLALEESDVAYWVDSICIDQRSVPEKNIQVPRMRTIYSEADFVWVYLGEGTYATITAMSFLTEVEAILDQIRSSPGYGTKRRIAELVEPHAQFRGKAFYQNESMLSHAKYSAHHQG